MRSRGYIMVETLVAMTILSISAFAIHRSIFETVSARREAHNLSLARHMLEDITGEIEMRPLLSPGGGSGDFTEEGHPEFTYEWEVTKVSVPLDSRRPRQGGFEGLFQNFIGKLRVTVYWSQGTSHITGETLLLPSQVWAPEGL